jgi:Rod binding domain-containing protein
MAPMDSITSSLPVSSTALPELRTSQVGERQRSSKQAPTSPEALLALGKLRQATGQVVGQVFYGTLLKTMRESSLKGKYGHGGRGEEVFKGQLHGLLAERLGEAQGDQGIADVMYRHFARQQRAMAEQHTGSGRMQTAHAVESRGGES